MAADAWKIYNRLKEFHGDGLIDMDGDEAMMALFLSTSNCATLTLDEFGDLTNEVATANGYTQNGVELTGLTWTEVAGTVTFDFDDAAFVASGGSIVARFAVVYSRAVLAYPTGTITQPLYGFSLLDNTPLDVTVTDSNTLTVQINASGMFTVSGGDT